jgi:hypothetical protein
MSYRPHLDTLKGDSPSHLQNILNNGILHSSEGKSISKNIQTPHLGQEAKLYDLDISASLRAGAACMSACGMNGLNESGYGSSHTKLFKPNLTQSRLSSNEGNLQAKKGQDNATYIPLNSLAGVLSSMKCRDRTISGASDSTVFSSISSKLPSQMVRPQVSKSPNLPSQQSLSSKCLTGKPITSFRTYLNSF